MKTCINHSNRHPLSFKSCFMQLVAIAYPDLAECRSIGFFYPQRGIYQ